MGKSLQMPDEVRELMMSLKGKQYLPVAARVLWFRIVHPNGRIATKAEQIDWVEKRAVFRCAIYDELGNELATATKQEDVKGFAEWLEKAEAGAVGRALGFAGFGTLDIEDAIPEDLTAKMVDSPVRAPSAPVRPASAPQRPTPARESQAAPPPVAPPAEAHTSETKKVGQSHIEDFLRVHYKVQGVAALNVLWGLIEADTKRSYPEETKKRWPKDLGAAMDVLERMTPQVVGVDTDDFAAFDDVDEGIS